MDERANLYSILEELIEADTVSSRPSLAALVRLADRLEASGARVSLQEWGAPGAEKANLIASLGPPEPHGLVLSGHVDVVPFADQPGWTRDPLRLTRDGDRLYGRGSSDMKGFLAQCTAAAARLDAAQLVRPVVWLFTSDEEIGCLGAARLVDALPELLGDVPVPRLAWIGEPTGCQVFRAHKGIVAFQVDVVGEGGHSSRPEAGVNAIAVAARAIAVIGAIQEERRARAPTEAAALYPEAPYTALNFGTIVGGTASNMIAEHCRFNVSYRPLPDEDPLALHAEVLARLADPPRDWGSPQRRAAIRVGPALVAPGFAAAPGSALEAVLREHFRAGPPGGAPYCTDAGHLASAGVDALICGPGELDQAHQPDESLSRSAFESGPDDVLAVIGRLCGRP